MAGEESIDNFEYVEANQCFMGESTTKFGLEYDMDQMKDMVRDADPGTVKKVAQGWAALSNDLVGGDGIKAAFEAAVQHVLAHWEGQSADLFRERAQVISKKITDSAKYAEYTSKSLAGAAKTLEDIKPKVLAMEKPSRVSSALDFAGDLGDRDASGADNSLKNGASSSDVLAKNEGSLSAGREAQLKMAEQMEILAAQYNRRALEMGSWKPRPGNPWTNEGEDYPGDPGGIPPAAVVLPTGSAPRSPQGATAGTARGGQVSAISSSKPVTPPSGITGGAHKPSVSQPQVSTAIDGVSGGLTETPTGGGPNTGGGVTSGSNGGSVPGAAAGAGAARGGVANRGGAGGMVGRGATGAGAGGVAGRAAAGAGGTVGRGAAGAGAGAAKGGAARAGGVARQSGGVVGGTPRAGTGAGPGKGTAGGSGLHRSRGAAGGASAVRKGGMVGVPGARTGRPNDEERREGERPDYLVEDEETWTPQTNAAPRVIE
ncbi:hypothetical protein SUDANB6_01541 [Streptomyces sp. enrichment culture]|uniref:hypothetical protein n=1 Tax=Streptomyces sp. enrichment culture TaxID=1795815 RepID=UPI003F5703AC